MRNVAAFVTIAAMGCVGQANQALIAGDGGGADGDVYDALDAPDISDATDVADDDGEVLVCTDADGDGYGGVDCGGDDCDDADATVFPGADEACNLRDDDCDDEIDDGLPPMIVFPDRDGDGWGDSDAPTIACGALPGFVTEGRDCSDASPDIYPGARERCNGFDDSCEGEIDEELPIRLCENQTGPCEGAVARCGGAAGWLPCGTEDYRRASALYEADEATCDGADNDCDGSVDEEMGRTACGIGACARAVDNCADGVPQVCVPGIPAVDETCGDGRDDDCDGRVDENPPCMCAPGDAQLCWTGDPALRGVGVCADGEQACAGGSWTACEGEVGPTVEMCDGLDNDCDGLFDEGLGETTCGVGACRRTTRNCVGGVPQTCEPGDPVAELCDGSLDDNCDGAVDEGCACRDGDVLACGSDVGECVAGTQTCAAGAWGACEGDVGPAPEACNGRDDDCDGMTDEGLGRTSCGLGACRRAVENCVGGVPQACVPGESAPEICDGADNDCDGAVDEELGMTSCGIGACERAVENCVEGVLQVCVPGAPSPEVCDGIDNDCDRVVDDGPAEVCDVIDNDCDGMVDEDLCGNGLCDRDCGETCVSCLADCGPAGAICCPGRYRCNGRAVEECSPSGLGWNFAGNCVEGCAMMGPRGACCLRGGRCA